MAAYQWCLAWIVSIELIPTRTDLWFDRTAKELAIRCALYLDDVDMVARELGLPGSSARDLLHRRNANRNWPNGRPGIADYLVAVYRRVNG